ncbi:hypothetical protein AM587_10007571 [Phytophthora nicotianae]|uniref:Uncharacterized protein n=1 Tax=Phytophthora nicotianae TaxID=4792 RepID=A0A0W8CEF8_PHYNI|nr:hypothetical protein AM587_10007571 [Phytophthora nicotianae]
MLYSRSTSMNNSRRRRARLTASRLRRSKLLTEVAMRKMNLDPAKTMQMEYISEQLSPEDISFFRHIFRQIDSSKAIDLQEWIVLCGMLVTPPHDEEDLLGAFQCLFPNEEDIPVVVFRTKMQRILENAYAHLPDSNQHEVSCYVDDILSALDPNDTECIDVQECIRILSTPYHGNPYPPSPTAQKHQQ